MCMKSKFQYHADDRSQFIPREATAQPSYVWTRLALISETPALTIPYVVVSDGEASVHPASRGE
jgi:hypothetical protein